MATPLAYNPRGPKTTHLQGQTSKAANAPIMSPTPPYSPPALSNTENNQTTIMTQPPAIVSTSFFTLFECFK